MAWLCVCFRQIYSVLCFMHVVPEFFEGCSISEPSVFFSWLIYSFTCSADLNLTLTTQPWIETWQIVIKLDSAFPFNCFNLLSKLLFKIVLCFKFHLFDWLEIILRRIFLIYYLVQDIVLAQSESDIKIYVKLQFYAPYPYLKLENLITNEVFGQPFLKMSRFETIFMSL